MKVKDLKQVINEIGARDDDKDIFSNGKLVTDVWWIDCSDGYVIGIETEKENQNE